MGRNLNVKSDADKTEWGTPQYFFNRCNELYGVFTLDAAASKDNAKCERYFSKDNNALTQDWAGVVWCNPPYGRETTGAFVRKAYYETGVGHAKRVVMLLPAATDTKWFHTYCINGLNVFIEGRLTFEGADSPAPFPSMLTIFAPKYQLARYSDMFSTTMKRG